MPAVDALPAAQAQPWAVAAIFLLAGLVKGVVGLGLPTLAMGMLGMFMPPAQAAALLVVPSFVTNLWQMLAGGALRRSLRRLWTMQAGIFAGTLWAPLSLATLDAHIAWAGLGSALIAYAALGIDAFRPAVPPNRERTAAPLVGLATGFVTAATGVFAVPAVPYLQGLGLPKDELVQALGLSFTVSTVALAARLAADGALGLGAANMGWALLVVPLLAALSSMAVGQVLRRRLSEPVFRRVFFTGLLLIGLHLLLKGVRAI